MTGKYSANAEQLTGFLPYVVCFGKLAEAVAEYVKRGNRIFVAGSLAQNTFEREDGERVYRTEVHAQETIFLDSNGNGRSNGNGNGSREAATVAAEVADDQPF